MLCDAADMPALAGDVQRARDLIDRARALAAPPFRIGIVYGLLGELDEAFAWLEQGGWRFDDRVLVEFDPRYEAIRADPRWPAILEQLKEELNVE